MIDRYRDPPPQSPTGTSRPTRISAYSSYEQPHRHVVPSCHEMFPSYSSSSASTIGTVTTTYRVTIDPILARNAPERCRSISTIDNYNQPPILGDNRRMRHSVTWEQRQSRMLVPPSSLALIDPIQRPAFFEPIEPLRQNSSRNELRRGPREDYKKDRDKERDRRERLHQHERYKDGVEQRGFSLRAEKAGRFERRERLITGIGLVRATTAAGYHSHQPKSE
jgi:hypothetical protein